MSEVQESRGGGRGSRSRGSVNAATGDEWLISRCQTAAYSAWRAMLRQSRSSGGLKRVRRVRRATVRSSGGQGRRNSVTKYAKKLARAVCTLLRRRTYVCLPFQSTYVLLLLTHLLLDCPQIIIVLLCVLNIYRIIKLLLLINSSSHHAYYH